MEDLDKLQLGELYEEPSLLKKAALICFKAAGVIIVLAALYVLLVIFLSL